MNTEHETTRSQIRRTGFLVAALLLLLGGMFMAPAAHAQCVTPVGGETMLPAPDGDAVCMEAAAGFGLNCTANDVQLANVLDITILDDGCAYPGDTVTFTGFAEVLLTAQARYDIGIFFSLDGDPNGDASISGVCSISTLPYGGQFEDPLNPPNCLNYTDLDGTDNDPNGVIQDVCGDISDDATTGTNPIFAEVGPITTVCRDDDGDGNLDLPN